MVGTPRALLCPCRPLSSRGSRASLPVRLLRYLLPHTSLGGPRSARGPLNARPQFPQSLSGPVPCFTGLGFGSLQRVQNGPCFRFRLGAPPRLPPQSKSRRLRRLVLRLHLRQEPLVRLPGTPSDVNILLSGLHSTPTLNLNTPQLANALQTLQTLSLRHQTIHPRSVRLQINLPCIEPLLKMSDPCHQPVIVGLKCVPCHHSLAVRGASRRHTLGVHRHTLQPPVGFLPDQSVLRLLHLLSDLYRFLNLRDAGRYALHFFDLLCSAGTVLALQPAGLLSRGLQVLQSDPEL